MLHQILRIRRFLILGILFSQVVPGLSAPSLPIKNTRFRNSSSTFSDSLTIRGLLQAADNYSNFDQLKALMYGRKALKLSEEQKDEKGLADSYRFIADINTTISNTDSVQFFCRQALDLYLKLQVKEETADVLTILGYSDFLHGNYTNAKNHYKQALQLYTAVGSQKGIAKIHNEFGLVYWTQGNYTQALSAFQQAIQLYETVKDPKWHSYAENNLGLIYLDMKQDSLALARFNKCLELNTRVGNVYGIALAYSNMGDVYQHLKQDSLALSYFNQSLSLSRQLDSQDGVASCLKSIGLLKIAQGNTTEGLAYLNEAMAIFRQIDNQEGLGQCLVNVARMYKQNGQLPEALAMAEESFQLAKKLNAKYLISQSAHLLATIYQQQKQYAQAMAFHDLFRQYEDSLLTAENIRKIEELRHSFQLEKKALENRKLRQEKELKEAQAQKLFLLMAIIGGMLFIANVLLLFLWKINHARKQANQLLIYQQSQILEQNEELRTANERLSELDGEKDALLSIVAHDLKSPLNRAAGLSQLIRLAGPLTDEQENYLRLIEKVSKDGGSLIADLMLLNQGQQSVVQPKLSPIDLASWIHSVVAGFESQAQNKDITLHFQPLTEPCEIVSDEEALTRILDNILSNALKFTRPGKNVFVGMHTVDGDIRITIRDEGPGISAEDQQKMFKKFQRLTPQPTQGETSIGLGLAIVKMLAEKIGAEILMESQLGKGTQFTLQIPRSAFTAQLYHSTARL